MRRNPCYWLGMVVVARWTPVPADRGGGVNVLVGIYANDDVHGYSIGHCEHLQAG